MTYTVGSIREIRSRTPERRTVIASVTGPDDHKGDVWLSVGVPLYDVRPFGDGYSLHEWCPSVWHDDHETLLAEITPGVITRAWACDFTVGG